MIQMENSSGSHCWIPASQSPAGTRADVKPNIQVQYSTNQQNMYNAPCSIYNVPTITLPPNPTQTYIIQEASQPHQTIQPTFIQTNSNNSTNKEEFLKCRHWPACKFYTSSSQSLKNHELTHYAQQNLYTCTDCNIHFTNKSSKDEHTRRKHKTWAKVYSCSHCNYETSVLDEFSEHNVAYHLDAGTSGQIYQCHQCNYSTSWKCFMDSHLLIHSNNELDYRVNKKAKFDSYNSKDDGQVKSDNTQVKQEQNAGQQNSTQQMVNKSPAKCTVSTANTVTYTTQQQHVAIQQHNAPQQHTTAQQSSANTVDQHNANTVPPQQQQQQHTSQSSNLLETMTTVSSQSISMPVQTTLSNIAPMPVSSNNTMSQLTTMASIGFNAGNGTQKQEYRCNMCHHFTTTCPNTLHQHIKSHNTCQECGYTSNSITELSLHVCHTYDGQNTYTNAILNTTDNAPPINFGAINAGYVQQSAYAVPSTANNNNNLHQQAQQGQQQAAAAAAAKKRPNRAVVDDDFQQGIYRCRKCNYGTSWKCFLDSHMLTHGGVI